MLLLCEFSYNSSFSFSTFSILRLMNPNCPHAGAARNKQTHNREECVCQKSDFLIFAAPLEDCHSSLVEVTCTLHCYMSLTHPYLHYHYVIGAGTPPPIMVRTKKPFAQSWPSIYTRRSSAVYFYVYVYFYKQRWLWTTYIQIQMHEFKCSFSHLHRREKKCAVVECEMTLIWWCIAA